MVAKGEVGGNKQIKKRKIEWVLWLFPYIFYHHHHLHLLKKKKKLSEVGKGTIAIIQLDNSQSPEESG